jgi:hypothetical protein
LYINQFREKQKLITSAVGTEEVIMNQQTVDIMFSLLRYELCSGKCLESDDVDVLQEQMDALYKISKFHDIAHLVGHALITQGLLTRESEFFKKYEKEQMLAVFRYEKMNYEFYELCNMLEEEKIPFLPLKGVIMRKYYPEPWMRTSCDIDILVRETDIVRATEAFVTHLKYTNNGSGPHDVSLTSPSGIHIELHYILLEDFRANENYKILKKVWNNVFLEENHAYQYTMNDEMFYFYHIVHMANHFVHGGCGIRPFIDLWILEHQVVHEDNKRNELLKQGGVFRFANCARCLSEVWFSNQTMDEISLNMQEYLLVGGIYGTVKNKVLVTQKKKGGRVRYILSRIFISYDSLKYLYPILQKHKWLTPVMQIRRWFRIVFCKRLRGSIYEISVSRNISKEQLFKTQMLLDSIGLCCPINHQQSEVVNRK